MNKIAIVGHPASGYQEVEALLHQCGMQSAQPSRREGLRPQDITATLCKAHKVPAVDAVAEEQDIVQIQPGPVWHGMALDLMLGNLDQELWGWADPQAVFALDYWKDLDPKLTFVLVYDEPHRVLAEAAQANGEPPSTQQVQRMLDNWVAYNSALLRFHLRNTGRSLLVHAKQVRRAADRYLQALQPLLDAPLRPAGAVLPAAEAALPAPAEGSVSATSDRLPAIVSQAVALAGIEAQQAAHLMTASPAEHYLVDGVLSGHPAALQLYAELQSAANLPLDRAARAGGSAAAAWEALVRQRSFVAELLRQVHAEYQRVDEALTQSRAQLEAAQARHTGDSQRLLANVRQLQEELERQRKHKLELEQRQAELLSERKTVDEAAAAHNERKLKELGEENELLLSQLHQVQEELERYYLENQRLKQKVAPPKPPGPYGAADRIKRQLSYRLGAVMIERSRSVGGWLGMPWALAAEARAFRQEAAARPAKKHPPIHTYRDAHEAERVKQHLSYRLGSTLLEHGKSPLGWLKLPFALRRQVREFRLQRKRNEK